MSHESTRRLFTLAEVVAEWDLGADMADPVRWLMRQIRAGRVRARKIGRSWRMTQADIDAALEAFGSPAPAQPAEDVQPRWGLSAGSMRRRIA